MSQADVLDHLRTLRARCHDELSDLGHYLLVCCERALLVDVRRERTEDR